MADRREQILVRLLAIGAALDGIVTATRNTLLTDEDARPAFQVIDADETVDDNDNPAPARQPPPGAARPVRVGMTPELYISIGAPPETVGTELNAFRAALIKAVMLDAELRSIVGENGHVRYEGMATGLSRGRTMEGEIGVSFTFVYPLRMGDL
jgi:hypothetical protein